jgi:hypothetical protein
MITILSMNRSTQLSIFFLTNFIFTLGSVVGFILWSNNTNNTEDYSYYSFCSIMNLLFVIVGSCLYNKLEEDDSVDTETNESYVNGGIFICISFCYTVLWVFASLFSTLAIQQCMIMSMNCSGVIMSTIFGYLLFILWSLSFFMLIL